MGNRVVIVIATDMWHRAKANPERFVQSIEDEMHNPGVTELASQMGWCDQYEHTSSPVVYKIDHVRPHRNETT